MQTRQCIMPHQSTATSFMIIYYRQNVSGKPVWTVWTRLRHIDKKTGLLIEFFLKKPDVIRIPFRWLKAYLNFQMCCYHMTIMAIRVVEFSNGVYKILPKNQHTQRKFLNFENWTNGEPQ